LRQEFGNILRIETRMRIFFNRQIVVSVITYNLDLRDIGWEGKDWIHLAQDRDQWQVLVNMEIVWVPHSVGNLLSSCWLFKKHRTPWSE
jgi:hypothetical protein